MIHGVAELSDIFGTWKTDVRDRLAGSWPSATFSFGCFSHGGSPYRLNGMFQNDSGHFKCTAQWLPFLSIRSIIFTGAPTTGFPAYIIAELACFSRMVALLKSLKGGISETGSLPSPTPVAVDIITALVFRWEVWPRRNAPGKR